MDWNAHQLTIPFVPTQESSFNFLRHYNHHDQFPGMERKHVVQTPDVRVSSSITERKKRLNSDQVESLESSFQEEIKLDPDRKMKLARELGLQPRQIAVWFQNRRARWRAKQLQNMYNALKQEFDVVCKEKHKLQQEVVALRKNLEGDATKKKEVSGGEETVDSTIRYQVPNSSGVGTVGGNCIINAEEYNALIIQQQQPPYWSCFPSCLPIMTDH